jgi:hypothetical protein
MSTRQGGKSITPHRRKKTIPTCHHKTNATRAANPLGGFAIAAGRVADRIRNVKRHQCALSCTHLFCTLVKYSEHFSLPGRFGQKATAMTMIKAIIRNGRIEVDHPLDLPDGTELTIAIPDPPKTLGIRDEDWSDTAEAIAAWIE